MEIRLSPEREKFVRRCVEGGQFRSDGEVFEAALKMLEAQTPRRSALPRAVEIGLEQVIAGRVGTVGLDEIRRRTSCQGRSS